MILMAIAGLIVLAAGVRLLLVRYSQRILQRRRLVHDLTHLLPIGRLPPTRPRYPRRHQLATRCRPALGRAGAEWFGQDDAACESPAAICGRPAAACCGWGRSCSISVSCGAASAGFRRILSPAFRPRHGTGNGRQRAIRTDRPEAIRRRRADRCRFRRRGRELARLNCTSLAEKNFRRAFARRTAAGAHRPRPHGRSRCCLCSTNHAPAWTRASASVSCAWLMSGFAATIAIAHVVLVTHHVEEIVPGIQNTLILATGRVHSAGPTHEVVTREDDRRRLPNAGSAASSKAAAGCGRFGMGRFK